MNKLTITKEKDQYAQGTRSWDQLSVAAKAENKKDVESIPGWKDFCDAYDPNDPYDLKKDTK